MDQEAVNEREWARPEHWSRLGFYRSALDTRTWVPKRNPALGWTVNMAHRSGRLSLLALLLVPMVLVLATLLFVHLAGRR
jgi:uncharacterized membrane protein